MIEASRLATALILIGAAVLLSGIGSCKKETGWQTHKFEERPIKPKAHDVQIPAELWNLVETGTAPTSGGVGKTEEAPAAAAGEHGDSAPAAKSPDAPAASRQPTAFEPLKVYLIERNKGVLKSGDTALSFPPGGGEFDLSEFVLPLRGSFHVVFEFLPKVESPQSKVFFMSNAISRKIGGETVGAGCNVYLDIGKAVESAYKGEGLLVNASDQRHVSALAGTYVFASNYDGKLHLSSLIIRDSQYRALQCRR